MKVSETMKLQESLSRQVQGIYAGFTMSLKWLKPLTSHTEISDIFFFKYLSTFLDFCFLLQHKYKGDQTDADVVPGFPEPPLLIYYT